LNFNPFGYLISFFCFLAAGNDFAEVEGSSPGIIFFYTKETFFELTDLKLKGLTSVRDEMVKLAHSQNLESGSQVVSAEMLLQEGHFIEVEKEYHYSSTNEMPFS